MHGLTSHRCCVHPKMVLSESSLISDVDHAADDFGVSFGQCQGQKNYQPRNHSETVA